MSFIDYHRLIYNCYHTLLIHMWLNDDKQWIGTKQWEAQQQLQQQTEQHIKLDLFSHNPCH